MTLPNFGALILPTFSIVVSCGFFGMLIAWIEPCISTKRGWNNSETVELLLYQVLISNNYASDAKIFE